jgi:hypothetical protein
MEASSSLPLRLLQTTRSIYVSGDSDVHGSHDSPMKADGYQDTQLTQVTGVSQTLEAYC